MRPKDRGRADALDAGLASFHLHVRPLPGIQSADCRQSLLEQLIESIHRVRYVARIRARPLSRCRADPGTDFFDPLKAAIINQHEGNADEACWLVFLFVHFGRSARTGWRLARDVYGSLGRKDIWTWSRVSSDPRAFREWLSAHMSRLRGDDGVLRYFGNHRKYQSLDAYSSNGTGAAIESYVHWVNPARTHEALFQHALQEADGNSRRAFRNLYHSMNAVASFGRTARFDYLTMIGKLGLSTVEPDSAYMQGATGPLAGARLLFGSPNGRPGLLDPWLAELDAHLDLDFGMQVLEDALCNWQKSPKVFAPFRG